MTYLVSTASKQRQRFPDNYPKQFVSGKGAYLTDKNGKSYLDFCCALGPVILGYRYEAVDEAVIRAIKDYGTIFSLSHPLEGRLSELLCDMIPSAEMVRFAHNGKDVTEAAVRLARHITGKERIISFSYHGAADVFMACTKANAGVPVCLRHTIIDVDYNDQKTIKGLFEEGNIAAIILEPHTIRMPENNYLKFLRDITKKNGALLIFDEIVSFPRYPKYSAQAYFGVMPDLTCVSKGMANGYAISALVGKRKYMKHLKDGEVFFSTTFGGNLVGVSAALKTLEIVVKYPVPEYLERLGNEFSDIFIQNDRVKLIGLPWRQFFECSDIDRQKIWQEMIKQGVFFHVPIFFNFSMNTKEMGDTARKLNDVVRRLDKIKIKGRQVREVFKKR